jgi:hypothetical protein
VTPQELGAGPPVQVSGRFVGEDDGGLVDQCTRDGGPLHLAAGQLTGRRVEAVTDAQVPRQHGRGFARGSGPDPVQQERHGDVLPRAQARREVEELEDESDASPAQQRELRIAQRSEIVAVQQDAYRGLP